jgi:hypothetical protein
MEGLALFKEINSWFYMSDTVISGWAFLLKALGNLRRTLIIGNGPGIQHFSVFRVHEQGRKTEYSPFKCSIENQSISPVSIKGIKEGDFAMIWGYPGSTNRYETSYGVKQKIDIDNPTLVTLRDMRLKYMFEEMKKDPAIKLQLAPEYANIANYWKFYDGESKQLVQYDVFDQKKKFEEEFMIWAKGKPEFENIFNEWPKAYDAWRPYSKHRMYINAESWLPLMYASTLQQVENAMLK